MLAEYKSRSRTPTLFPQRYSAYPSEIIGQHVHGTTFHDLRHTYATKLLANGKGGTGLFIAVIGLWIGYIPIKLITNHELKKFIERVEDNAK